MATFALHELAYFPTSDAAQASELKLVLVNKGAGAAVDPASESKWNFAGMGCFVACMHPVR